MFITTVFENQRLMNFLKENIEKVKGKRVCI